MRLQQLGRQPVGRRTERPCRNYPAPDRTRSSRCSHGEGLLRFHELAQTETRFRKAVSFATHDVDNFPSAPPMDGESQLHDPGLDEYLEQDAFYVAEPMYPGTNEYPDGPTGVANEVGNFIFTAVEDLTVAPSTSTISATPFDLPTLDASDIPADTIASYPEWEAWHGLTDADPDPDSDLHRQPARSLRRHRPVHPRRRRPHPPPPAPHRPKPLSDRDRRSRPTRTSLDAELQSSPDLEAWFFHAPISPPHGANNITAVFDLTPDQLREFFRLHVTEP